MKILLKEYSAFCEAYHDNRKEQARKAFNLIRKNKFKDVSSEGWQLVCDAFDTYLRKT